MNEIRRFRKKRKEAARKINKAKSAVLKLSLIMLNFIFATFAWFTYTMILNPRVDVNVSAWQVDFKDSDGTLGTTLQFQVGNFYPGMEDVTKQIEIVNLGDREASIGYRIDRFSILGQVYRIEYTEQEDPESEDEVAVVNSEAEDEEEPVEKVLYATEYIDEETGLKVTKLLNSEGLMEFPFEINITHSPTIGIEDPYDETKNKGSFEIRFIWRYEITGTAEEIEAKNQLDTQWGHDIADFYSKQEGAEETLPGIELEIQAIAEQII